jgi:RND family efflux transporter MFP subunit
MTGSKVALLLVPGVLLAAVVGLGIGVRFRDNVLQTLGGQPVATQAPPATLPSANKPAEGKTLYTCAMHPSIIRDKPGLCPICKMELTAIHVHGDSLPTAGIQIDPVTVQNMGVRTVAAVEGELRQSVRAVGTLTEPEQAHRDINLRVSGWIQKLYANQEGMAVNEGDPLFDLYSPEITAAAEELIAARKSLATVDAANDPVMARSSETIIAAGKRKLQLLGLTLAQVDDIARQDKTPATVTIASPMHGHVAEKMVIEGSAVRPGEVLMKIANRTTMWLQLQVFEQQLGSVAVGQKVRAKIAAYPDRVFEGKVDFIYPHLDPSTRSATVRIVLDNPDHKLHENMYATAEIDVPAQGRTVLIPREAVIDTGRRQVVFLAEGDGHFTARDIAVGRSGRLGAGSGEPEMVQVASGLSAGDTVVTSGQFLLDSESRMREAQAKFLRNEADANTGMAAAPAAATPAPAPETPAPAVASPQALADSRVAALIEAYLPLAATLGAPQQDPTPINVTPLRKAAEALAAADTPELKTIGDSLIPAINALNGQPIDGQRKAFKPVSKQIVALAKAAPLPPNLGKLYAFECTMDHSVWLQVTDTPANPYFAVEMKQCGEVTQTLDQKAAATK